VRRVFGRIAPAELQAIDIGLCLYLGIDVPLRPGLQTAHS
jgi:hypothetical protein